MSTTATTTASERTGTRRSARGVLVLQFADPALYPPLVNVARLLARTCQRVGLVGARTSAGDALGTPALPDVDVRIVDATRTGAGRAFGYVRFAAVCLSRAVRRRVEWAYVCDTMAAPVGLLLTYLPGCRVVYHEHDAPATDGASRFVRLCLRARRRLVRRAALVVVPNAERAHVLIADADAKAPVATVWNCPMLAELPTARRSANTGRLRVVYHGSVVPDRVPLTLLSALARVPDAELAVIGYETAGYPTYLSELRREADRLGVGDRLAVLGAMPRAEVLARLPNYDLGLSLMPRNSDDVNMKHMTGASNKAFDNLGCAVPLLVSDAPDWRTTFVDAGYAVACDPRDVASIAGALEWCVANRGGLREMGEAGRRRVEREWNYERQFANVAAAMRPPAVVRAEGE